MGVRIELSHADDDDGSQYSVVQLVAEVHGVAVTEFVGNQR